MIDQLHIHNYKSIKSLSLGCSRINLFIGEPNSGKSNILEALDLSYLSWMMGMNAHYKLNNTELIDLKQFFRVNQVSDLFYLGNLKNKISISHPGFSTGTFIEYLFSEKENGNYFEFTNLGGSFTDFDNNFNLIEPFNTYSSPIAPYRYKSDVQFHDTGNHISNLMAPFGNNLAKVIYHNDDMLQFTKDFASKNGFEFNIDQSTNSITIQLRINEGVVYNLPYYALADTYKRMIFYTAAVRHTWAKVITLDEPDTHAFPPFVSALADEIIQHSDMQFFIATHNPYLLNNFIENTPEEQLSVFVTSYNKITKTTSAKKLTANNLSELLDYGVDIFFNLNSYADESIEHTS